MPFDVLQKHIAALAGKSIWQQGLKLFTEGAILDAHPSSRSLEARIANDQGAFESIRITIRQRRINASCTCSRRSPFCEHAIAGLLLLAEERPELVSFLKEASADDSSDAALPVADAVEPAPLAPASGRLPGLTVESLRDLLHGAGAGPRLLLHAAEPLTTMESHWNRVQLKAAIVHGGRTYAQGNLKRLVESGHAAGSMQMADFSPQEQQVMSLVVQHADTSGTSFQVDAFLFADLLHCLIGFSEFHTPAGRLHIHSQPLEAVIVSQQDADGTQVTPGFQLPGHGQLPPGRPAYISGRGGYWLLLSAECWWFPGLLPGSWLRLFLKGEPLRLSNAELTALEHLCSNRQIPLRLLPAAAAPGLHIETGHCTPVLALDWVDGQVEAALAFEYAGKQVGSNGPPLLWEKDRFVCRDDEREQRARAEIRRLGFAATAEKDDHFSLDGTQAIWNLMQQRLPDMEQQWRLYWTPQFQRARQASSDAVLSVSAGKESASWFETQCMLRTEDGTAVPWEVVSAAVEQGLSFIRLENGGILRLPGDVQRILALLRSHAAKGADAGCRFNLYSAIPLADILEPYWEGQRAAWQTLRQRLLNPGEEPLPTLSAELAERLRDYQKEGVRWLGVLAECGFHGILADEMGLGKTVQALAALSACKRKQTGHKSSIIICPTSLLENWLVEATRFVPELRCTVIRGNDRQQLLRHIGDFDVIITSYALLRRDIVDYEQVAFDYIILDEAQHIKNPRTANARTCKELRGEHRLILTGTPVENSLTEVWSLFDFLLPGYLGTHRDFRRQYEAGETPEQQAAATRQLAAHIHPFTLRRTKRDVCAELPPKLEQIVYCEFADEQRRLYDTVMAAGRQLLDLARRGGWQEHRFDLLSILLRLRQICCHPKLIPATLRKGFPARIPSVKTDLAQEVILEAIDSGHRVLLFSQFTGVLALFPPWLKRNGIPYEYLDGSTTDRQERVDRFNQDASIPVFLLSLKAGGTGLNLTGADTVIHYDQWWNPMVEDQATDRTHRIGQTRPVTAVKLITRHTIEEKILDLQASKRDLFQQLLVGAPGKLGDLTPEDVEFLLENPA